MNLPQESQQQQSAALSPDGMKRRGQIVPAPPEQEVALSITSIRRDATIQARVGLHEPTIHEYTDAMASGRQFPPVLVFHDGETYWLADGFHRVEAQARRGRDSIRALVCAGGRRDAILAAAGANATHGLRRTNADKRRAVALLLQDDEWSRWSDREVARRCGVSPTFVGSLRDELSVHGGQMDGARRLVERGGVTYEMDTEGIGEEARQLTDEAKAQLAKLEGSIERARSRAVEIIREIEAMGVTLEPTGATMPEGMAFEDWKRGMKLLADLHILAGIPGLADVPDLGDVVIADPEMESYLFIDGKRVSTPEEDAELEASILDLGLLVPQIIVWAETRILLDGYRRLAVARKHGIPYEVVTISKASWEDAARFRVEFQFLRKQYTPEEAAEAREGYARYAQERGLVKRRAG